MWRHEVEPEMTTIPEPLVRFALLAIKAHPSVLRQREPPNLFKSHRSLPLWQPRNPTSRRYTQGILSRFPLYSVNVVWRIKLARVRLLRSGTYIMTDALPPNKPNLFATVHSATEFTTILYTNCYVLLIKKTTRALSFNYGRYPSQVHCRGSHAPRSCRYWSFLLKRDVRQNVTQ